MFNIGQIRSTVLELEFKGGRKMPKTIGAKTLQGRRLAAMAAGGVSLALASLPGAALAGVPPGVPVWEGFVTITSATPPCLAVVDNANQGQTLVSIFRPKIRTTDTITWLSIVGARGVEDFGNTSESTVPQMHGSGNYKAAQVTGRALPLSYSGTYSLTVTPAAIIASTPVVTISGTINNVQSVDVVGCNVTFKGVYVKRID